MPDAIPKVLHRIRLATDVLPPEADFYERRWKELHPNWEHRTWTPANLPPLINRELFDLSENTGHRSDILRFELLHRFGGVYIDLDMLPQKPLDPLIEANPHGFLGLIKPTPRAACLQRIETAIFAAAPGNPFVEHLIQQMPAWATSHAEMPTAVRTGPQFVQVQLDRWTADHPLPLTLHPPEYFYPYLWNEPHRASEPFPRAYAIHRWWGSWRRQKQRFAGHAPPPSPRPAEELFTANFNGPWQGCGPGSSPEASRPYRHFVEDFIRLNDIHSVLEIGCGDWQVSRYIPWDGLRYTGLDVMSELIDLNTRRFGSDSIRFLHADARSADLPPADLILAKDVLQHWSNSEIAGFLPKLDRYPFSLITNTTNRVPSNRDCATGGYRFLDLTKPPFNLSAAALLRYTASRPGQHPDEKTVLLHRGKSAANEPFPAGDVVP